MRKIWRLLVMCLTMLAMIVSSWCVASTTCEHVTVHAEEAQASVQEVATAIETLKPTIKAPRRDRLAVVFHKAAQDHRHDPLLLVAISFRESSFFLAVEQRRRFGTARNENGLMQVHGAALRVRPADCSSKLIGARCQIQTGAAWLSYAREHCEGSTWRWVAAYGMSACPSERRARLDYPTRRAHSFYKRVGGRRWSDSAPPPR